MDGFREQITYKYRKKFNLIDKAVIYYLAETKSKTVVLSFEHINFEWLNFNDALERLSFENSKKVLKLANEFLSNLKRDE